ncbi:MAG: hypothetical protein IKE95_09665 [Methanobrevibacter sp.]|nr:hypothetical protein [Methanobrevibacter sp.]
MAKKIKKYRVGLESETYAISLVESPAIEEVLVALEEQKQIKVQLANEEKHMVYSAVLVPDRPIYRRNEDGEEFYVEFTKESIEKMSQQFFKEYKQNEITLDHKTTASDITVVESWLKADLYKDKSVALGLNPDLPVGTWFCAMKVNQIDVWDRIKNGELRGFSVESLIHLEEFNKIENNETMEVDNETFWAKLKSVLAEAFGKEKEEEVEQNKIEPTNIELEEEKPTETPVEEPKVEEPTEVKEEPKEEPIEPKEEPKEEVKPEEPKQDNHLEELINNLKDEISALKEMNQGLQAKIKDLGKQPSSKPVNTNSKPNPADTYAAWRETMRNYVS